jgi:hypothetical protein
VGTLNAASGRFQAAAAPWAAPRYVAPGGMAALAEHLASPDGQAGPLFELRRPMWVSGMRAVEGKGWQLTGNNKSQVGGLGELWGRGAVACGRAGAWDGRLRVELRVGLRLVFGLSDIDGFKHPAGLL